jgi:hypothetical protein
LRGGGGIFGGRNSAVNVITISPRSVTRSINVNIDVWSAVEPESLEEAFRSEAELGETTDDRRIERERRGVSRSNATPGASRERERRAKGLLF